MWIVIRGEFVVIILGICVDFFSNSVKGLGIKVVVSVVVVLGMVFIKGEIVENVGKWIIRGLKFGWFLILKIWEIVERLSVLLVRLYIVLVGMVINCFVFNKAVV